MNLQLRYGVNNTAPETDTEGESIMPVPKAVQTQLEAAEEALKKAQQEQKQDPSPGVAKPPTPQEQIEDPKGSDEQQTPTPPAEEGLKGQIQSLTEQLDKRENDRSAFEGRYAKEREEAQAEIEALRQQNQEYQKALAQKKADEFTADLSVEKVYDDETREMLGDDYLNAMLKAAQVQARAVAQKTESRFNEFDDRIQNREKDMYLRTVLSGVGLTEQELMRVNNSKEFNDWLEQPDGYSGRRTVFDTLDEATRTGDVPTTIGVYKAFIDTLKAAPPSQGDTPAVMPQASAQTGGAVTPTYTMNEVAALFQKGKISHREMTTMMQELDKAAERKIAAEMGR